MKQFRDEVELEAGPLQPEFGAPRSAPPMNSLLCPLALSPHGMHSYSHLTLHLYSLCLCILPSYHLLPATTLPHPRRQRATPLPAGPQAQHPHGQVHAAGAGWLWGWGVGSSVGSEAHEQSISWGMRCDSCMACCALGLCDVDLHRAPSSPPALPLARYPPPAAGHAAVAQGGERRHGAH